MSILNSSLQLDSKQKIHWNICIARQYQLPWFQMVICHYCTTHFSCLHLFDLTLWLAVARTPGLFNVLSSVPFTVCHHPEDSGSVFYLRRDFFFPRLFIFGASSWVNSFCGLLQTLSANLSAFFFFDFLGSGCLSDVGCLPVAQCPDKLVHKHRPDRA